MSENDFFTIFVFPFKYERGDGKELKPDEIAKRLNPVENKNLGWQIETYKLDCSDNYNEYYYFHPFVREAIFNKKGTRGIEYLVREDYKYLEVEYSINDTRRHCISVDVKSMDLHLFDNQIGLLTITTEKRQEDNETSFHDFLRYNDITRRVYPPFITSDIQNTNAAKYSAGLLPSRMTLFHIYADKNKDISECFTPIAFNSDKDILYLSNIVKELLSPFKLKDKHNMTKDNDTVYYTPFTDDRMFLVSYYSENKLSNDLRRKCCDGYEYESSDDWYSFIFVDGKKGTGIDNNTMMRELIQRHTYSRWAGSGTLFGLSRYSLVMLCNKHPYWSKKFKQDMKSMYYQMALIVLFQRAMLLKFSDDIFEITSKLEKLKLEKLQDKTSKLHRDFIKFINKYWFIEVTPQEQGIEMYNQWMNLLNLDKLYQEIEKEISELAKHVDNKVEFEIMRAETERTKRIEMITLYGFPLAVIALVIALWQAYAPGFDSFKSLYTGAGIKEFINDFRLLNSFILLVPACVIAYFVTRIFIRKMLNKISSSKAKIPGMSK